MLESLILGMLQGISEWLPVSSEGILFLIKNNFFQDGSLENILKQSLFLHLGTFFAVLVYLRKDVLVLLKSFFSKSDNSYENKKIVNFLILATLISGFIGFFFMQFLLELDYLLDITGKTINLIIGFLLLITAFLQFKSSKAGQRKSNDLNYKDGILLGFMQGLAVLPGLSRSGLTVSGLLLRKFDEYYALKLSFLMSMPIVLAGNIFLNLNSFMFSWVSLIGFLSAFIFGLLTIDILLKIAKKINFGYFVLAFGILLILSVLV